MKNALMISAAIAVIIAMVVSVVPVSVDAAEDEGFDVKFNLKGTDYTTHFDGPVDKVVVFGYAAALTVLDTDQVDKLYACDKYADDAYKEKGMTRESKLVANLSSANVDSIYAFLVQALQSGELTEDSAIILTTMTTPSAALIPDLKEAGFKHIVFYGSMTEYADLIQCVKEIEMIVGSTKDLYKNMQYICDKLADLLQDVPKKDALFVWYSPSNGWGYGNTGSLSVTMINAGGGNNLGYTPGNTSGIIYNEAGVVQKLSDSPQAVIFLDDGYIRSYGGSVDQFVDTVLGGNQGEHIICVSEHAWNNYCPESADGLWKMAHVMHPDIVDADVPVYTDAGGNDGNIVLYVGVGVGVVVIAAAALYLLRMRH